MAIYAVVDGGSVTNVIVADQAFADMVAPLHQAVVPAEGFGIGASYVLPDGLTLWGPQ